MFNVLSRMTFSDIRDLRSSSPPPPLVPFCYVIVNVIINIHISHHYCHWITECPLVIFWSSSERRRQKDIPPYNDHPETINPVSAGEGLSSHAIVRWMSVRWSLLKGIAWPPGTNVSIVSVLCPEGFSYSVGHNHGHCVRHHPNIFCRFSLLPSSP